MIDVIELFSLSTESIRGKHVVLDENWLAEHDARPCSGNMFNYTNPPWNASQEAFEVTGDKKHCCWVDVLKNDKEPVQIVMNFSYPNRRWFSRRKKDLDKILNTAQQQFGDSKALGVATKTGKLFSCKPMNILVTSFAEGKRSFIEIKIARGRFLS